MKTFIEFTCSGVKTTIALDAIFSIEARGTVTFINGIQVDQKYEDILQHLQNQNSEIDRDLTKKG